jgi:hypothetical protein
MALRDRDPAEQQSGFTLDRQQLGARQRRHDRLVA